VALVALCGAAPSQSRVESIRVHGNHETPDPEILQIAAIAPGDAFGTDTAELVKERLESSGRFAEVDIRVRYRGLDESSDVALVIVVREKQSIPSRFMMSPIVKLSDEYGFTFGANLAFVDLFTEGGRLSFPLSWGGERRVAIRGDFPLQKLGSEGLTHHIRFFTDRERTVNPHFDLPDNRLKIGAGLTSRFRFLSLGFSGDWTDVSFEPWEERFVTLGASAVFDTRVDASVPGDAVYLGVGWRHYFFQEAAERSDINRLSFDLRGYKRLIGRSLLAAQFYTHLSDSALPEYEQPFLGGGATLRGTKAGRFIGDNIAHGTVELRLPLTSPLSFSRAGFHFFYDTGAVFADGERLSDAEFHHGVGVGFFFRIAVIGVRADVGWDLEGGTRFHVGSGFRF
jgi:outer membrane protein assembly factor BamA